MGEGEVRWWGRTGRNNGRYDLVMTGRNSRKQGVVSEDREMERGSCGGGEGGAVGERGLWGGMRNRTKYGVVGSGGCEEGEG